MEIREGKEKQEANDVMNMRCSLSFLIFFVLQKCWDMISWWRWNTNTMSMFSEWRVFFTHTHVRLLVAQWVVIGQYAMGQSLMDRSIDYVRITSLIIILLFIIILYYYYIIIILLLLLYYYYILLLCTTLYDTLGQRLQEQHNQDYWDDDVRWSGQHTANENECPWWLAIWWKSERWQKWMIFFSLSVNRLQPPHLKDLYTDRYQHTNEQGVRMARKSKEKPKQSPAEALMPSVK